MTLMTIAISAMTSCASGLSVAFMMLPKASITVNCCQLARRFLFRLLQGREDPPPGAAMTNWLVAGLRLTAGYALAEPFCSGLTLSEFRVCIADLACSFLNSSRVG